MIGRMRRRCSRGFGSSPRAGANAGFTLVELTVALVAGLIVALGIVTLSKESTQTFHEEVRISAAEATMRAAVDRLRADLARGGYMSTGNIVWDPQIAAAPGATNVATINAAFLGLRRLASIHLIRGGSAAKSPLSASQTPVLTPDAIEIGGNMTSADQYEALTLQAGPGGCQRIMMSPTSPAMYRVNAVGAVAAAQEFRNLFQPVPAALKTQFIVRVIDDAGKTQYVATCAEANAAGFDASVPPQPYVDIDATTPIQTAQGTGTVSSITGFTGVRWVNPVQIVRWEITNADPAQYAVLNGQALAPGTADPNKYDLIRSYVDAKGVIVPETTELVAEYAVDLSFAFSVDNGLTSANPNVVSFAFDDATNQTWANDVSTVAANPGPQRIRSVRARIVTRTAQPDRTINVPLATQFTGQEFMYRYCLATPCGTVDGTLRWARARTVTTEISLPNQSRNF